MYFLQAYTLPFSTESVFPALFIAELMCAGMTSAVKPNHHSPSTYYRDLSVITACIDIIM